MHLEFRALIAATAVSFASVGFALLAGLVMQPHRAVTSVPAVQELSKAALATSSSSNSAMAERGAHLYLQNCAHCHADDATGDEGPDLHGLRKSDARIATIIKNGIKGEMPKFNQKLTDNDVQDLVGYLRTLH